MTRLDQEHLFSAELPAGAGPACAALSRLAALTQEKKKAGEATSAATTEARAMYAELLLRVEGLGHPDDAPSLGSSAELRGRFVESVLLWLEFCKTSSVPSIDSVGTRSIRVFPIDLPPDETASARLKAALMSSQGLTPAELAAAEERVAKLTLTLHHKLALTSALGRELEAAGPPDQRGYVELMREFYGPLPLRPRDVDFVLTSTGIFFVLPIAGEQLDVPDWELRPEAERAELSAFLKRIARENMTETWRFPAFGLLDAERLQPLLIERLSVGAGLPRETVQKTLITMVSILPKAELDQYLVHDAWGHTWQEVLNEFEWEYARLRSISEPLSPGDGPIFGGPAVAALGDAFEALDGSTVLHERRLLESAEADLRGRIQVGLSQALSEVLADFVEAKFSRLNPEHPLPTSSLLDPQSMKLDLTIQDVLRQARRSSRPYRDLWSKPAEQGRWVAALADRGLPAPGLVAAVARAASALEERFGAALRPVIAGGVQAQGGAPGSTVATRALLELALFCRELEQVLDESAARRSSQAWTEPTYCPDLWAVSLSHMYEADRKNRFWCLDTLVRRSLREACDALGKALEVASA